MDGWNTIVSFWFSAYFQVRLLLVSGRVVDFDATFRYIHTWVAPRKIVMFRQIILWVSSQFGIDSCRYQSIGCPDAVATPVKIVHQTHYVTRVHRVPHPVTHYVQVPVKHVSWRHYRSWRWEEGCILWNLHQVFKLWNGFDLLLCSLHLGKTTELFHSYLSKKGWNHQLFSAVFIVQTWLNIVDWTQPMF